MQQAILNDFYMLIIDLSAKAEEEKENKPKGKKQLGFKFLNKKDVSKSETNEISNKIDELLKNKKFLLKTDWVTYVIADEETKTYRIAEFDTIKGQPCPSGHLVNMNDYKPDTEMFITGFPCSEYRKDGGPKNRESNTLNFFESLLKMHRAEIIEIGTNETLVSTQAIKKRFYPMKFYGQRTDRIPTIEEI